MRYWITWATAYAFAIASTLLASLYGFMSAVGAYAIAKAFILGLVAFGGCHGPAYVTRLRRSVGGTAALLALCATLACLLVTLWGGLGTIAGGGAELRAERQKAQEERQSALRAESEAAHGLEAAQESARRECATGRGKRCGEAETALATAQSRADDARQRLAGVPPAPEPDPQAAAASRLTGLSIELTAALYAFAASLACELMGMVAMLMAWAERRENIPRPGKAEEVERPPAAAGRRRPPPQLAATGIGHPGKNVVTIQLKSVFGSIKKFAAAEIAPADGERLELGALLEQYRLWCKEGGVSAAEPTRFLDEIERLFEIEPDGATVYVLNVRLAA